jgi:hypothetical protein
MQKSSATDEDSSEPQFVEVNLLAFWLLKQFAKPEDRKILDSVKFQTKAVTFEKKNQ